MPGATLAAGLSPGTAPSLKDGKGTAEPKVAPAA